MKNLKIKITGISKQNHLIVIDDKEINVKKNSFGSYEQIVQTEKESVNIKIKTILEIKSNFWFITNLFFFIISLFGILDYRFPKKCLVISYEANIKVPNEQNEATISLLVQQPDKPCAEVKTECEVDEIKNICEQDRLALKRMKTLRITKGILWIALIVTVILLLTMGII